MKLPGFSYELSVLASLSVQPVVVIVDFLWFLLWESPGLNLFMSLTLAMRSLLWQVDPWLNHVVLRYGIRAAFSHWSSLHLWDPLG